eukprot:COSAG02_NODE_21289_length_794_cov_1.625899_2_plen_23_part_01
MLWPARAHVRETQKREPGDGGID